MHARSTTTAKSKGRQTFIAICCFAVSISLAGCVQETKESDGSAETVKKAIVVGVGEVKVGGMVRHRQLGSGRITEIAVVGEAVTASIMFRGGERPMLIDPEYFHLQKRRSP